MRRWAAAAMIVVAACGGSSTETPIGAPTTTTEPAGDVTTTMAGPATLLDVEVIDTIDHDPSSFTQGLVRTSGGFYESVGLTGQSALLELDAEGATLRRVDVPEEFFAEGLELVDGRLIQLTFQAETAFVYDATSFELVDQLPYQGEGWGLCVLDERLVMSNGSAALTFRDPVSFEPLTTIDVTLDGQPVEQLNELECVNDTVWANVWQQDIIVGIDPTSGQVHSVVDASVLRDQPDQSTDGVLNGIAHDDRSDTFWLTGKNWSTMYEVRFIPRP